jgi:hypothetical protein
MIVRASVADHVVTSLRNVPFEICIGGAPMANSSLNRPMTVRLGSGVAFAQIGICGFDGTIKLEALRLFDLSGETPALLCSRVVRRLRTRQRSVGFTVEPGKTN